MHLPSMNVLIQVTIIGLLTGGVYALMAAGLTLIFGVMRVINIAHGAFLILSAYISYWLFKLFGIEPVLSVLLSVPFLFLIGVLLQRFVLNKVQNEPGLVVLITFSLALMMEGIMVTLWETTGRTIRTDYTSEILAIPVGDAELRLPWVRIAGFLLSIIALFILNFILNRTNLGRAIRATTQNPTAAQLVGVDVMRVQALTFGLGLGTVAAGGALFSVIWSFTPAEHAAWISKMLSIIVLGGMGSLPGAFIAAIIMGLAEQLAAVTMTSYISPIVFYLILFLTLVFRPQGLLGTRIREG